MSENESESVPSEKAVTPEESSALFEEYERRDAALHAAEEAVVRARNARTEQVQAIRSRLGGTMFHWRGERLMASQKGGTHFFKRQRMAGAIKISSPSSDG